MPTDFFFTAGEKKNPGSSPLHAFLQLTLLANLGELFLVVLAHFALFRSAPRVVFDALHLLLPRLHQLVIALAEFLLLRCRGKERKGRKLDTN